MGLFMAVEQREIHEMIKENPSLVADLIDNDYRLSEDDEERINLLLSICFPHEKYRCSYCVDHIDGHCHGKKLRGKKAVKTCMGQRVKMGELQIFYIKEK